jgi:hypothetical protein
MVGLKNKMIQHRLLDRIRVWHFGSGMMDTQSELRQKRQEIRQEILALQEQIPLVQILKRLGKGFRHNSLGYWIANIVLLNGILLLPWTLLGLVLKEIQRPGPVSVASIVCIELVILGIIAAYFALRVMLDEIRDCIVEKINSANDVSKLLLWLKKTWSLQSVSAFALPFCLIWTSLGVAGMCLIIKQFVGFGLTLTVILVGLLASLLFYVPVWASFMIVSLKNYRYEVNAIAPADSEIISNISEMMMKGIYTLAAGFALITLVATSSLVNRQLRVTFSLPLLLFFWTVIIAQFLLTRSTLSAVINRAKWTTLNKIQARINTLEETGDLSDKDTAERLFRLVDLHKEIMASKSSALDLKSFSTLVTQLMLPLLGWLLGNLDKLSKLLP